MIAQQEETAQPYSAQRPAMEQTTSDSRARLSSRDMAQHYLDIASVIILVLDPEGKVVLINKKGCDILGYAESYIPGKSWVDHFLPPEARDEVRQVFADIVAGRMDLAEYHENDVLTSSGETRLIAWHNSAIRDENGRITGILSSGEDITERRQVEEALRASQQYLQAVLDSTGDAIFVDDADTMQIIDVNHRMCEMYGYTREEALRISIGDLSQGEPPYSQAEAVEWLRKARESGPQTFEWLAKRKDGQLFWVEVSIRFAVTGGQNRFVVSVRDITDRKRVQQELTDWMRRYELVVAASGQVAYDYHVPSGAIMWGSSMKQVLGYEPHEIKGGFAQWLDLLHPDDREATVRYLSEAEATCSYWDAQYRLRHKDGHYVWIRDRGFFVPDAAGKAERQLGVLEDITERKRAEDALRESEERFRSLYENTAIGLYRTTPDGRILMANPALVRMLGYQSFNELAQRNLATEGYEPGYSRREFQERLERDGEVRGLEAAWTRRDGSAIFIRESARVVRDANGRPLYYEGTVEDITERKRAEDAIRRLNAELERRVRERTAELEASNKELESFAYSVSHDLRAPLRAMDGFSALLLERYHNLLDEQGRHYLQRIQTASRRMGQLINDLLSLSRVTRADLARETVDLSALALEISASLQARDPQRQVEWDIAGGMVARGDRRLLRLVLENLLDNAWKFTAPRLRAHIHVGVKDEDGQRVYFVRDDGVGFDMAYVDKLFIPFQRLHGMEEFPGSGMGLAIVQRIVARHGGRVWAEAAPDRGATFCFTLGE